MHLLHRLGPSFLQLSIFIFNQFIYCSSIMKLFIYFLIFLNLIESNLCQVYEFISPRIINSRYNKLYIKFNAFNKNFTLDLKHKNLVPDFLHKSINKIYDKRKQSNCHFKGNVVGVPDSWASVSYCDQLLNGHFKADEVVYHLKHMNYKEKAKIYVDTKPNYHCGVVNDNFTANKQINRERRFANDESDVFNVTRYVELVVVNDYKVYQKYGKNVDFINKRTKQIVNIVNGLYRPFNIIVVLAGVVVWSEKDEINITIDSSETLNNFIKYRREILMKYIPNDNAQLITGSSFESGIVGKALKQTICTYEYSGGVNSDYNENINLVATTIAHELGHNFGMEHDTNGCSCMEKNCIMSPSSTNPTPLHWSSCSVNQLKESFKHGIDHCLLNEPKIIFKPNCGNGIVDEGEECDCGLPEFCTNSCCNATTCKLSKDAECANGKCCDQKLCKIIKKEKNFVCRKSISVCDISETCDGISPYCPKNLFVKDGTECLEGYAYCFRGRCDSRESQCKLLWGNTGQVADYRCYHHNMYLNNSGNCGYDKELKKYIACESVKDIICGRLHCTHHSKKLQYGPEGAAIISKSVEFRKGKIECNSAIIDLGLYEQDPGLVPNGAKCGFKSMCVNQKCVSITKYLQNKSCPYNCNNNGLCDNEGHCHCYSENSNSYDCGTYSSRYYLTILIYIILFLVFPLLTVVAFVFYNNNRQIFKNWFHRKKFISKDYNNKKRKRNPTNLDISYPLEHLNKESIISQPAPTSTILKPIRPAPPIPPVKISDQANLNSEQEPAKPNLNRSNTQRPKRAPPLPPTSSRLNEESKTVNSTIQSKINYFERK